MNWYDVLGYLLVVAPVIILTPQIIKTIKTQEVEGLSLSSQFAWTLSYVVWMVYALSIGSIPIFANNMLGLIGDTVLLFFILVYSLKEHNIKTLIKREGSHIIVLLAIIPVILVYIFFGIEAAVIALTVGDFVALIPQLVTSFKSKSLSGLSLPTWWFKLTAVTGWIVYGYAINEPLSTLWAWSMILIYVPIIIRIYRDRMKHYEPETVTGIIDISMHTKD